MANNFLKILLGNLLLSQGPQDFPCSSVLMRLCLLANFITGVLVSQVNIGFGSAVLSMILDLFVLLLFVYLVLQALSKSERFTQTIIALAAVGVVYQTLAFLWRSSIDMDAKAPEDMTGFVILFLIFSSWTLAVITHIFRQSFNVKLPVAVVLTICYVTISVLAQGIFLPELVKTGA